MIVKEKKFSPSTDPRVRAGDEAEKSMAFRLERRFGHEPRVHVINDLRIEHEGNAFQIDHLLVTPWGLFIVESKSVHCPVTIKVWDDKREHWSRNFDGKTEGIDSPVLQAEEQGRLLKIFMRDNTEQMLGKMIGLVQKGFGYCPIISFVAISSSGVIEVASGALHKSVLKADEIAPEIDRQIASLKKKAKLLNLSLDTGWEMTEEEAAKVASFLVSAHCQKQTQRQEAPLPSKESPLPISIHAGTVPRVGAFCPKCGTRKLVRKSVQRSDGTETDFLACGGYPHDCTQIFALTTKPIDAPKTEVVPRLSSAVSITGKPPCRQSGKKYCYRCKTDIEQKVADYCFDRPDQFSGRAYCRSCQRELRREQ